MTHGLPRSSADIAAARAEVERQLAPLQRKAELLEQMAEIQEEWERLSGDVPPAAVSIPGVGQRANKDAPPASMSKRAKAILKENPGQYLIVREIWQASVDRGWIAPNRETRAAMRVALRRLAERDDSIESVARPPTHAYRWLPPSMPEPNLNGTGRGLWEAGVEMR